MRRRAALTAILALLPGLALAALQGENLLVPPMPAGWQKSYGGSGNGINMVAYVPANETADVWTQQITIAVYAGRKDVNPQGLKQIIANGLGQNCEALHVTDLGTGSISGLPAARWATFCSKLKQLDRGEITYYVSIGGHSHLFLVQRTWRGAAFDVAKPPVTEATLQEWEKYFDQIGVCDSADPTRPCP